MKKIILAFFLISSVAAHAQERKDVQNFFKLCVFNEKNEVLLIKFKGEWEVPGASYDLPVTIAQHLDSMALRHGITIAEKKLRAMLTFFYDVRPQPLTMFYYTARYRSGDLKTPVWGDDLKWFSIEEAMRIIPYAAMTKILAKILADQHTVWGGALEIHVDKETRKQSGAKELEALYKLN